MILKLNEIVSTGKSKSGSPANSTRNTYSNRMTDIDNQLEIIIFFIYLKRK